MTFILEEEGKDGEALPHAGPYLFWLCVIPMA
jgi:hypothetical protein